MKIYTMDLFRDKKYSVIDIGLIKWSCILSGMVLGAYFSDFTLRYLWLFIIVAVILAIKPVSKIKRRKGMVNMSLDSFKRHIGRHWQIITILDKKISGKISRADGIGLRLRLIKPFTVATLSGQGQRWEMIA